jgi:hypothetical protein
MNAVGGSGPNDVWASGTDPVGLASVLYHWDGSSWAESPSPGAGYQFNGIWANGASDAWIVGNVALHWDGRAWSSASTGTSSTLNAVWGNASKDMWAVGDQGVILHYPR